MCQKCVDSACEAQTALLDSKPSSLCLISSPAHRPHSSTGTNSYRITLRSNYLLIKDDALLANGLLAGLHVPRLRSNH